MRRALRRMMQRRFDYETALIRVFGINRSGSNGLRGRRQGAGFVCGHETGERCGDLDCLLRDPERHDDPNPDAFGGRQHVDRDHRW